MRARLYASVVLGIFLFVVVLGLPMLLTHSGHHVGCPLQGAQTVMCESTVLEHFSIWQTMFASLISLFTLACFALIAVGSVQSAALSGERVQFRLRRVHVRPTLFQELFSQGILNRKEPYAFS